MCRDSRQGLDHLSFVKILANLTEYNFVLFYLFHIHYVQLAWKILAKKGINDEPNLVGFDDS